VKLGSIKTQFGKFIADFVVQKCHKATSFALESMVFGKWDATTSAMSRNA